MKIHELLKEDEQIDEFAGILRALGTMGKAFAPAARQGLRAPSALQRLMRPISNVAKAGKNVAKRGGTFTLGAINLTDEALKWYGRYQGIWKPIKEYYDTMAPWQKKLDDGEITQKQFEYVREKEMSFMLGRIASYIAVSGIVRGTILPAVAGLKLWGATRLAGNTIANIAGSSLSAAGRAGQVYAVDNWINSEEGRQMLASAFAEGPLGDMVAPILGGSAAKLADKIKGKARPQDDEDEVKSKETDPTSPWNTQTIPKDSDTTGYVPSEYSNMVRNPKTGELKLKTY